MTISAAKLRNLEATLAAQAAEREAIEHTAAAEAAAAVDAFDSWYQATAVTALATQLAGISSTAQNVIRGAGTEYVRGAAAALGVANPRRLPTTLRIPVRNGADPVIVHSRPAALYRRLRSQGVNELDAAAAAQQRAADAVSTDVMLANRDNVINLFDRAGYKRYRRVIRPELSQTGTCGLCVAAADRTYSTRELLPIHGRCNCEVLPITAKGDAAQVLNEIDLSRAYTDAGSTLRRDLAKVRYQVRTHGEYGPVLTVAGQKFTGPDDIPILPAA